MIRLRAALLVAALGLACGPEPQVPPGPPQPDPDEQLDVHMAEAKGFGDYSEQLLTEWLAAAPN